MINLKKANKQLKEWTKLKSLYTSSFPKNERLPIFVLSYLVWRKKAEFFAIYNNEE